jgi:nucleotide-binding universal stress UspA family protein
MPAQHLLVALDLSIASEPVLAYAIALAGPLQAHLTLLHVVDPLLLPTARAPHALEDSLLRQMQPSLAHVTAAGIAGEVVIGHGAPFREILQTATARHVDLIVMGSHGRTGLPHLLLGSVAERVLRLAPCPVLIVRCPPDTPTHAGPLPPAEERPQ